MRVYTAHDRIIVNRDLHDKHVMLFMLQLMFIVHLLPITLSKVLTNNKSQELIHFYVTKAPFTTALKPLIMQALAADSADSAADPIRRWWTRPVLQEREASGELVGQVGVCLTSLCSTNAQNEYTALVSLCAFVFGPSRYRIRR